MVKAIKESFHLNGDKDTREAVKKLTAWASLIVVVGGIASWVISGVIWKIENEFSIKANSEKLVDVQEDVDCMKSDLDGVEDKLGDIQVSVGILLERTKP